MGRKRKLTKLVVLFVLYFFLIQYSVLYSTSYSGASAFPGSHGSASGRTLRSDVLPRVTASEQSRPSFYLLTSMGTRFQPNVTIVVPEGTRLAVAVVSTNTSRNFTVLVDGNFTRNFTTGRFALERGVHSVEVLLENSTIARREVQVVTQETRETLQNPQKTEPLGLRRKSALAAALAAATTVPLGMYLKRRRAREEVL